jgi:DNA-binding response OmpR family regulator/tetratricopeptide (TPR) repeat protein
MRLALDSLEIDLDQGEVRRGSEVASLTAREVGLLRELAAHPHQAVDHRQLIEALWRDGNGTAKGLQRLVRRVREKIEPDPSRPRRLVTLRSLGYRLDPGEIRPDGPPEEEVLQLGATTRVELHTGTVERHGSRQSLTATETALLRYLGQRVGCFAGVAELLREVWGYSDKAQSRTLDTTLRRLRVKLEDDPDDPRFVLRERGRGVRLAAVVGRSLPPEPSFGRDGERAALLALLATARCVTVHGAGGAGKSHLARQVVAHASDAPGGRWWVSLAGATSVGEALRRVRDTLRSSEARNDVPELGRALARRPDCLVVLDAAEGVHDALSPVLETWRELAPSARFVVTSRRTMALAGAAAFPVGRLPDAAIRALVVATLADLGPPATEAQLDDLVARADGEPLAAQLLASGAAPLGGSVPSLAQVRRHADESRLTSLHTSVAVSWDPCTDEERLALAVLSAASSGLDLHALRGLFGTRAEALVTALATSSLLRVVPDAEGDRYVPGGLVRAFARTSDAWAPAVDRYASWVVARGLELEAASLSDRPAGVEAGVDALVPEIHHALDTGRLEAVALAGLLLALVDLLAQRHADTVRRLAHAVAEQAADLRAHPDLAAAALCAGRLRVWPHEADWDALHAWARTQTDPRLVRWSYHFELFQRNWAGDRDAGLAVSAAGLDHLASLPGFHERLTLLAHHVDQLSYVGGSGTELLQATLDRDAERIPPMWLAHLRYRLANLYRKAGCYRSARSEARRSVAAFRALDMPVLAFNPLRLQAQCALHIGALDEAQETSRQALSLLDQAGDGASAAFAHRTAALLALEHGDLDGAIAALDAADASATRGGAPQVVPFNHALRGVAFHLEGALAAARASYASCWSLSRVHTDTRMFCAAWAALAHAGTPEATAWRDRFEEEAGGSWQGAQIAAWFGGPEPALRSPEGTGSCFLRLTERLLAT